MESYQVKIQRTSTWNFQVEAEDDEEAFSMAEGLSCDNGDEDYEEWHTEVLDAGGNELDYEEYLNRLDAF